MEYREKPSRVKPRIIIHGGAGNITRENLPQTAYQAYRVALLDILNDAHGMLQKSGAVAIDVATYAVTLLENSPLFNAGHGAVFTRAETHELEASVMVSNGYRKRGVGVMRVTKAKHPILLAKEMLMRGEADDGGGAGPHCQLAGDICDELAMQWGLEMVQPGYFWTRKRWDEHRRGLGKPTNDQTYARHRRIADEDLGKDDYDAREHDIKAQYARSDPTWDGKEYLPQGTVGCVVLDSTGTICVATSTGGLTNKLPGRIGDTPTLGAGFWAEEWQVGAPRPDTSLSFGSLLGSASFLSDCMPNLTRYLPVSAMAEDDIHQQSDVRAVGMSGTGIGDSFLRINAVRTAAAMARFVPNSPTSVGRVPLQDTVGAVAGPEGALQRSAEDRWKKTGEGEGGIIGIDLQEGVGKVVADFNCGGMFRVWVGEDGEKRMAVFREEL